MRILLKYHFLRIRILKLKIPQKIFTNLSRPKYSFIHLEFIVLSHYHRQQSKKKVTKVDLEKCRTRINKCNKVQCSDDEDPICGNDAQTYKNQCHLDQATCLYVYKTILKLTILCTASATALKMRLN